MTRLALALLAVLGFAAPLVMRQVDPVAQTCGAGPAKEEETASTERTPRRALAVARASLPPPAAGPTPPVVEPQRRYLLHRAWLL